MAGSEVLRRANIDNFVVLDCHSSIFYDPPCFIDCHDRPVKQQQSSHIFPFFMSMTTTFDTVWSHIDVSMFLNLIGDNIVDNKRMD
jgi:hypothetical protein